MNYVTEVCSGQGQKSEQRKTTKNFSLLKQPFRLLFNYGLDMSIVPDVFDYTFNQNYNKILERDWLSAARFEH